MFGAAERDELADFLRRLKDHTRARVLFTSRSDERSWLGNLPMRITIPPMPMRDSRQLAYALVARNRDTQVGTTAANWFPLLHYAHGNPAKVITMVAQAQSEGITTSEQIAESVERLRTEKPIV